MTKKLDDILEKLHSDSARLTYLKRIHTPENIEIADRILSLDPENYTFLEREIEYAKKKNLTNRVLELGRQLIDLYIKNELGITARDKVIELRHKDLAHYTINRLIEETPNESSMEYASEIANAFGESDMEKRILNELLKVQKKKGEFLFSAADTAVKLGKYDEAVDLYMESAKDAFGFLDQALDAAQEHAPHKLKKVAQFGFNKFTQDRGFWKIYVRCAQILDKTNVAKERLLKEAKKIKIKPESGIVGSKNYYDFIPRYYQNLVEGLVSLGCTTEAENIVDQVAINETKLRRIDERYNHNERQKELAQLYHTIGRTDEVKRIHVELIDMIPLSGYGPENGLRAIDEAIELTCDQTLQEKKFRFLEVQENYKAAEKLARKLKMDDLVAIYSQI